MPIYNRLERYLTRTRTSRAALARAIGVRPNTIGDIAANKNHRTDLDIWSAIFDFFGRPSFDSMFYIANEPEDDKNV